MKAKIFHSYGCEVSCVEDICIDGMIHAQRVTDYESHPNVTYWKSFEHCDGSCQNYDLGNEIPIEVQKIVNLLKEKTEQLSKEELFDFWRKKVYEANLSNEVEAEPLVSLERLLRAVKIYDRDKEEEDDKDLENKPENYPRKDENVKYDLKQALADIHIPDSRLGK